MFHFLLPKQAWTEWGIRLRDEVSVHIPSIGKMNVITLCVCVCVCVFYIYARPSIGKTNVVTSWLIQQSKTRFVSLLSKSFVTSSPFAENLKIVQETQRLHLPHNPPLSSNLLSQIFSSTVHAARMSCWWHRAPAPAPCIRALDAAR